MTPRRKILIIRSVNVHGTARALRHLRARAPEAEITLLLPTHLEEFLAESPSVDRFVFYDARPGGKGWREAFNLIRQLRHEQFDEVVVLCSSQTRIANLYDIILFSLLIPAKRRIMLDRHMRESDLSWGDRLRGVLDHVILIVALPVAALMTWLLLAGGRRSGSGNGSRQRHVGRAEKIAILVPILPDISHTFVYREVLAMKRHGAEFILIALEEGDYQVVHPEAGELLQSAIFVPKCSLSQYVLYYLFFAFLFPRRMAEVIRVCQPYAHGDAFLFLRASQFHNPFHPVHGLGLAWMLRQLGVTSLHVYGSTYPTTRAMTAACLLGIPFSITAFVDFDFDYDFKMLPEKLRQSSFFVTHTEFCRSRLSAVNPTVDASKIRTIRIGVDAREWRLATPPETAHVPQLLAVCRFVEKKGLDILLRACSILKERGVPFQCLLIGDGPEMGRLQSLAEELDLSGEVRFTGPIQTDQVRAYLRPGNVIVAPSIYAKDGERDGIPTVLVEALACGVPVVASAISGIPELIEDGKSGLLVPERDAQRVASAIETVLIDPDLRARLRQNGRRKILREFEVHVNALRLWTLIVKSSAAMN